MPSWAMSAGVIPLMPRSMAATVNRRSPWAATTYGRRSTPRGQLGPGHPRRGQHRASRSALARRRRAPLKMPTRIAPRSRRCRVRARVSMPQIPTTPCSTSSSSRDRASASWTGAGQGRARHTRPPRCAGLVVLVVPAGVADVRCGHDDDLPVIGRVGEGLLVAGHPRGEDRLAEGLPHGAERLAEEGAAVLEDQRCGSRCLRSDVAGLTRSPPGRTGREPASVCRALAAQERRDDRGGQGAPVPGVVAGQRLAGRRSTVQRRVGVDEHEVGRLAHLDRPALIGQPGDPGRGEGHPVGHLGPAQQPRPDGHLGDDGERRLQTEHPERRIRERVLLVVPGVRGVVGRDGVDDTVDERREDGRAVLVGSQRRVDLEDRVVAGEQVGAQREVVRGHLGGDGDPLGLGPADDLDRRGGRHVRDMDPRAGMPRQLDIAGDDDVLGDRRPGRQPEPAGDLALVAAGRPVGEPGVLGVLGDGAAERLDVVQGPAHEPGVVDALAVVGEDPHPGPRAGHEAELGELGALASPLDTAPIGCTSTSPAARPRSNTRSAASAVSVTGEVLAIARIAVKPPRPQRPSRSRRSRRPRDRLAQVGVQVDQAGQQDEPGGVDDGEPTPAALARSRDRPDLGDDAVADEDVSALVSQQVRALEQEVGHAAASVSPASR
jgi:hypothetical protein